MTTDWDLIRDLMAAVIDGCEQIEAAGYAEADRERTFQAREQQVSLYDLMISSQTILEDLRYSIIRDRHDQGVDAPYVSEAARVIVRMAEACAELIGAAVVEAAEDRARKAIDWYRHYAIPTIIRTLATSERSELG